MMYKIIYCSIFFLLCISIDGTEFIVVCQVIFVCLFACFIIPILCNIFFINLFLFVLQISHHHI